MVGILGGDVGGDFLRKSEEIARLVAGEAPQGSNIEDIDILMHDFKLRGIDPKVGIVAAVKEMKQGGVKMYRQGETILAIKKLNPTAAQMHFFTKDKEEAFRQHVTFWLDKFKQAGGQIIYDKVADPHIIRALQAYGAQLQPSDVAEFKLKAMV
jgi:hypothetical protein